LLTRQYIDEHQVLERYLADKLSDVERDQFEDYYTQHPEMLHELDAAASIKLGTALLRQSGELERLTKPPRSARWRTALALAASLLLALVAGTYWFSRNDGPPVILAGNLAELRSPLSLGASYQLQRTRSDVDVLVTLPATPQAIRLRVRPAFEPRPQRYRVELSSIAEAGDARTPVARLGQLELDAEGFVPVYVDTAYLRPGMYELELLDDTAPRTAPRTNEFLIEVMASPPPR
jgi:hypothetical protein